MAGALLRFWHHVSNPAMWPLIRLFCEMSSAALQGNPAANPILDNIVDAWLELCAEPGLRLGIPQEVAVADARPCVATVRGLLFDLPATGDRATVDAAMERFVAALNASLSADRPVTVRRSIARAEVSTHAQ